MKEDVKKFLAEGLWWVHLGVILIGIFLGFVFSWWLVVIVFVLHRIHLHLGGGCIMTKMQRALGGLPDGIGFLQDIVRRVNGKVISKRAVKIFDWSIVGMAILVGMIFDGMFWGMEEQVMAMAFEAIEEVGMEIGIG